MEKEERGSFYATQLALRHSDRLGVVLDERQHHVYNYVLSKVPLLPPDFFINPMSEMVMVRSVDLHIS